MNVATMDPSNVEKCQDDESRLTLVYARSREHVQSKHLAVVYSFYHQYSLPAGQDEIIVPTVCVNLNKNEAVSHRSVLLRYV
ncbi:hypothetical protein TNCT_503551 [Trichonephila clavata]|uniref:Uncharacterized protein n=1 Tax=Trichonephila clavata TaxID=2740835 RepID=A0A8X6HMW4_TRICU|nr:hypothetical protein TNCT_503551 [Trichonephila clavata]